MSRRDPKTRAEALALLEADPDWVRGKRFGNSLKKVKERYQNGCPDSVVASLLMMRDEVEVDERYREIVAKLRDLVGADKEDS